MSVLQALVLGIVQGLTEFLPVSSSGHLLLLEKLGVGTPDLFFNICLHLGTLLSVLVCMRRDIAALFRKEGRKTLLLIFLASLPTGVIALLFETFAPGLARGAALPFGFMATTVLLVVSHFLAPSSRPLDTRSALAAGAVQGIAVLPGLSRSGATVAALRSGATVAALRLAGVEKTQAARFSFLLSVPVIVASALYEGVSLASAGTPPAADPLAVTVGVAAAFFSGTVAVRFFLALFERRSLIPFAVYTAMLSAFSFLLYYTPLFA